VVGGLGIQDILLYSTNSERAGAKTQAGYTILLQLVLLLFFYYVQQEKDLHLLVCLSVFFLWDLCFYGDVLWFISLAYQWVASCYVRGWQLGIGRKTPHEITHSGLAVNACFRLLTNNMSCMWRSRLSLP